MCSAMIRLLNDSLITFSAYPQPKNADWEFWMLWKLHFFKSEQFNSFKKIGDAPVLLTGDAPVLET